MTTKYKLPNKLSVILLENKKAPVVSVHLWVKTGSADERKGEEGISHFIEHLVFKGTRDFKVGEIAHTIEGAGGDLNAYTTFDQTVFHITISKNYYEKALHAISQMAGFPCFDPTEIDNEREVVIEEIKRSQDSPESQASQLLFNTAFSQHPYGLPIIGYEKVIKNVSRKTLINYFAKRYGPQNMTLIVSGDFEVQTMKAAINKYFGEIPSRKIEARRRKKDPASRAVKIKINQTSFEESYVYLGWKIPPIRHKDIVALDVLSMLLGEGASSRLHRIMRLESATVNYVGTGCLTIKDPGLFLIATTLNEQNLGEFFNKLNGALKEILFFPPTVGELQRCTTQLEAEEYYNLETVDGLNRKAGYLDYFLGDYRFYPKYLKRVYSLKPEDIVKVARKYLDPQRLTIAGLVKKNKSQAQKLAQVWAKSFGKIFQESKKIKIKKEKQLQKSAIKLNLGQNSTEPKFEEYRLKNGMRVIFRLAKDTPVISLKAGFLGGLRTEPDNKQGLVDLVSRTWCAGAGNLSEKEIDEMTDGMAAKLNAFAGRNSIGLSMTLLSPFEKQGVDLFSKVIAAPQFKPEILSREKEMMLEALKVQLDQPSYIATVEFLKQIFKGHPYARDPMGTKESIKNLKREDVLAYFGNLTESSGSLVVVSGWAEPEIWIDQLNNSLASWKPTKTMTACTLNLLNEDKFSFIPLKKEQTHIVVGYRGLTIASSQRFALEILLSILGGMAGRLFVELREKASLAYSVAPIHILGIDTGYCGAYIGCSPEKGKTAIEMMLKEFEKISQSPPSENELQRAKKYLIGRHDIELQRNSAWASEILFKEIYGQSYKEIFDYAEQINQVTAKDVQQLAQQIFSQKKVVVAVGPSSPW